MSFIRLLLSLSRTQLVHFTATTIILIFEGDYIMAMKYCDKHDIWYDYKEGCPECGKVGRIAGTILGNIIGAGIVGSVTAVKKIKEYYKRQKEIQAKRISASIHKVWQEHNVVVKGEKGMNIHVKFEVNNMLNITGSCNAYFRDKRGQPLKDCNGIYRSSDGQVAISERFTPPYQNCSYDDFVLFMPYSELHLPIGSHTIRFLVEIFNYTSSLAHSDDYDFTINWQGVDKNNTKPIMPPFPLSYNHYSDILDEIKKVIDHTSKLAVIIKVGDVYVQFFALDENTIQFECVSDYYLPRIGNKDKEFSTILFTRESCGGGNYVRNYSTKKISRIIEDTEYIFTMIYKVPFKNYEIEEIVLS